MTTQGDNKKQKDTIGSTKHAEKDSREEQRPSGLTRSSPLTKLYVESFRKLPMLKFQKGIFPY
jgi:hypothetical protein